MTPFRLSLLSAAIVCSIAPSFADQTSPVYGIRDKTPNLLAFTNATVHTEPGKTLENATVLVVDGKISAVGSSAVPAGYRKIDATGHHLYAGFIDAYSSYGTEKAAGEKTFEFGGKPVYQNSRKGGNASNGAIHAEQQWVNTFVPSADDAKAYQQQGFTAVQSARFDGIFRGQSFVASLANGLPGELILKANGPQFMAFGKGSSKQSYPSSLMGSIALIRQTLSDANWYRDAYGKQDQLQSRQPVEFNAALSALTNLEQSGLVFETSDDRALLRVDSLLKEFNLKNAVLLGSGYEYSRVADIKNTGRTVIVPVAYPAAPAVANIDDQLDVSLADLRHWERAPTNLAVMAKAGVPFALTTHALEKKDQFWPNLRQAMKHGLTAEQALAGLTTVPAKLVGLPEQLGKIAVGYQADLVIAKGDLFADGEIVSTWTRGQEQQFKPLKPVEFAGTYAVDLAGKTLTLELSGTGDKLSGKLKQADKHSELKNVQQKQQQLQFTVDLAAAEAGTGVLQFQGVLDGNLLNGQWLLPSGQTQKVMLSKQATTAEAQDSKNGDKKADAVDTKLVSMLTFPNRAFGTQLAQGRQNAHIKNATVWTSDKAGKLENTDVIIKDGKFSKIGENLSTPSGYQVIDATGMHLTAGIIDEHSHIAIEAGVNEGTDAVTSEVQIGDVLNPEDINIYRGLAGGTTTAQLLHGSANPIGGQAQIIQLRWGVTPEQLKFKDAPPSIKFALGENVKQANWGEDFTSRYPQSRIGVETTIRDAFQAAKEYKAAFAAYDDLSRGNKDKVAPPRRDFRLQALVEILDKQRYVHTHSYVASEILMLIHLADEVGFKIHTFTHILEGYKVADEMAKHGASASSFADWWAYKMEVQDAIPTNTCLMADRGVMVSINSDSPDLQRRLNQEAAKSVKYCGMSEIDALNMVTINPAKQLNIQDKVGSITEGKQADFVLWTHHPLSVYAQAKQTWIDGIRYYDQERDAQVAAQVAAEKQQLMQKVLGAADSAKKGSGGAVKKDDPIWHCEDNGDWLHAKFSQGQIQHQHSAH